MAEFHQNFLYYVHLKNKTIFTLSNLGLFLHYSFKEEICYMLC